LAAFIGAVSTSVVVWILSWKGDANPFRLVLSGIIITSLLSGYISFAMIRAQLHDASVAQFWLTGSLERANWTTTFPVAIAIIMSAPLLGWVSYQLLPTALGTDMAQALGSRVNAVQFSVLILAVALTAVAVSAAGPIGFVAFVAPQLALRICRTATPPLLASAFTGAILLLGADVVIHALLGIELPVGIVTSIIGGLFLLYLLVQQNRKVQSV
jgi:hemin ABC superfamily ATP binding cassette transporter, ABC protein